MTCECIETLDAKIKEQNVRLKIAVWIDRRTLEMRHTVVIGAEKANPKSRVRPPAVIPTFCPFCGVRYKPELSAEPSPAAAEVLGPTNPNEPT